jgi:hypothetical protein
VTFFETRLAICYILLKVANDRRLQRFEGCWMPTDYEADLERVRQARPGTLKVRGSQGVMFPISPETYLALMLFFAAVFYFGNIGAARLDATASGPIKHAAEFFLLNAEKNVPTLFNFSLIVVNIVLLSMLTLRAFAGRDGWRWHWAVLVAIFIYLSYDEAAQIHERFAPLGAYFVEAEGIFRFSWVVPVAPVVLFAGLAYLKFVLDQPREIMMLMILSGTVYLCGAIGAEMASAFYVENFGDYGSFTYHLIAGAEEVVEMAGMALFGYALMKLLELRSDPTMRTERT